MDAHLWNELTDLFREVFADPGITLDPSTTAADIDGWDSISHATLIVAVESRFGIRFATRDLLTLRNVGDLAAAVAARRAG